MLIKVNIAHRPPRATGSAGVGAVENRFREDLYYRLNVVPVYLPPLKGPPGRIYLFSSTISSKNTTGNSVGR
jgi:transcriptional regulator with GAF, ATPase, and Fis domain